jgi:hypothetical protein
LQCPLRVHLQAATGLELLRRHTCRLRGLQLLGQHSRSVQRGRQGDLRVALRPGFTIGSLTSRLERALVRVDRPRQCEPVVALADRFVRLLHCGGGCGERLGRVLVGAGGAGGVDGALRALDFFLGRFGTGGEENQRADRSGETTHRPEV